MDRKQKIGRFSYLYCEDCVSDPEVQDLREQDVICDACGKKLCGHHMMKHEHISFTCIACNVAYNKSYMAHHLEQLHCVSIAWRGA